MNQPPLQPPETPRIDAEAGLRNIQSIIESKGRTDDSLARQIAAKVYPEYGADWFGDINPLNQRFHIYEQTFRDAEAKRANIASIIQPLIAPLQRENERLRDALKKCMEAMKLGMTIRDSDDPIWEDDNEIQKVVDKVNVALQTAAALLAEK